MRPNNAAPSASDARPDWEAPAFTKLPIANRTGVGRECGKRSRSRGRTGSTWPAPIQARLFI